MSIFGSREDDPLLQDDPFAPSSGDDASNENETADHNSPNDHASEDGSSSGGPARTDRGAASHPATTDTLAGSVFESSTEPNDPSPRESSAADEESRVIFRSEEQAAGGQLETLNAAIDEGWRLQRVEFRSAASPEQTRSADTTRSLAFVLRRARS